MKIIIFLLILHIIYVNSSRRLKFGIRRRKLTPPTGPPRSTLLVSTDYLSQILDHTDPLDTVVWNQRYMVNTEFFDSKNRNVAFLMIGAEGEISESWMTYGAWTVTAEKYGAILFQLEHRYYGKSQPFSDWSTENLKYLSSEQAIADVASFIPEMNKKYDLSQDIKWIVFGGSYGGSLAAWARLKYPEVIQGAMSSSGPLFAKLEFSEYYDKVVEDMTSYSEDCVNVVQTAISQIDDLLNNPDKGNLTALFNLCDNIENSIQNTLDVDLFYDMLTDPFTYGSQYNSYSGYTLNEICDILTDETEGTEIERLAEVLSLDGECIDFKYDHTVKALKQITTNDVGMERQFVYQTCTEFGWFSSTSEENRVFGSRINANTSVSLCEDAYSQDFDENYIVKQIDTTNSNYGGLNINASNIVYVHGSFDPWSMVGLRKTTNPDSPVIIIEGGYHCDNMYVSSLDSPELVAARDEVDRLIGVWLGENAG